MIKKIDTLIYTQSNNWDLIPAQKENEFTLYEPKLIYSREDIEKEIKIENSEFSLKDKDWIVATMQNEDVDEFLKNPEIIIEVLSRWNGFPSAYEYTNNDVKRWKASRIPIWKISSTKTKDSLQIQTNPDLYATKLITNLPTLALVLDYNQFKYRVVPSFI
jgi:hypothetical protein